VLHSKQTTITVARLGRVQGALCLGWVGAGNWDSLPLSVL